MLTQLSLGFGRDLRGHAVARASESRPGCLQARSGCSRAEQPRARFNPRPQAGTATSGQDRYMVLKERCRQASPYALPCLDANPLANPVRSSPEPLATIDVSPPIQSGNQSARDQSAKDDVYATTDEALYGQNTTAEVRTLGIHACKQA